MQAPSAVGWTTKQRLMMFWQHKRPLVILVASTILIGIGVIVLFSVAEFETLYARFTKQKGQDSANVTKIYTFVAPLNGTLLPNSTMVPGNTTNGTNPQGINATVLSNTTNLPQNGITSTNGTVVSVATPNNGTLTNGKNITFPNNSTTLNTTYTTIPNANANALLNSSTTKTGNLSQSINNNYLVSPQNNSSLNTISNSTTNQQNNQAFTTKKLHHLNFQQRSDYSKQRSYVSTNRHSKAAAKKNKQNVQNLKAKYQKHYSTIFSKRKFHS